ncbi:SDR family oxidoreductase [Paenibacillus sp. GCM10027627]|uniref:SDR family oxidoreductase n=1 Tax=unclassified Paenibacillus TaxID=185978 RepID=UPI0036334A94
MGVKSNLKGNHVVVIGGSSGIGLAAAKKASDLGAVVTIVGRNRERLQEATADFFGTIHHAVLDARNEDEVRSFFSGAGEIDHLIVTAGELTHGTGNVATLDTASAREQFESRFWGPYHAVRHAAAYIRDHGSITLTSGFFGDKAVPGAAIPSAVHGALEHLGRVLAVELAPVRVNVISPGYANTPLHHGTPTEQRQAWFASLAPTLPVRHIASADEIADGILFLLESSYTTGITLTIDGGARLV